MVVVTFVIVVDAGIVLLLLLMVLLLLLLFWLCVCSVGGHVIHYPGCLSHGVKPESIDHELTKATDFFVHTPDRM